MTVVITVSAWATFSQSEYQGATVERLKFFIHMCAESVVSGLAYWCLVFVLALAIATALWLVLMLLIWVPSDFFRNYVGLEVFSKALQNIKPFIYRSPASPGMTSIPLLDYLSLYSAFIFGPWFGVMSILSKYQKSKTLSASSPDSI
ncbi:hypothetical protein [Kaarinaea lacus]